MEIIEKNLENLSAFWQRTGGFTADSLPHDGPMAVHPALSQKVNPQGGLEPFMGCTAVFVLPLELPNKIDAFQTMLYQSCGDILAEPLNRETFHITLHDLVSGKPCQETDRAVSSMRGIAMPLIREIAEHGGSIRMRSTRLFNMVNTSMVLGFAPADEESCRLLMACYAHLQKAVWLNHCLTPHVTLAYFRPGVIPPPAVARLRETVAQANAREKIEAVLSLNQVEYQYFSDMNHFWRA